MYERFNDSITWYVCFDTHLGEPFMVQRLLNRKFRHVYLWRQAGEGSILINPLAQATCIRHCDIPIEKAIENELVNGVSAIVQHTVHYASHYKPRLPMPQYCVTQASKILCVGGAITPYGLYKKLIQAGCSVIKPFTIP